MEDQSNVTDRGSVALIMLHTMSCVLASQFISSERNFFLKATPPPKATDTDWYMESCEGNARIPFCAYPLFPFKP